MTIFDYFLLGWWGMSAFITVATVGKPKKPLEPLAGAFALLIFCGLAVGLLWSRGVFA